MMYSGLAWVQVILKYSYFVYFIREIGMMNPADLAKDTSGTRAYADFIVDLTSRIPSLVLNNISLLICHLDGEVRSCNNNNKKNGCQTSQTVQNNGWSTDNILSNLHLSFT